MELREVAELFLQSLQDATVFERSGGGPLVETDVIRKENKNWVVVAAGLDFDEAYEYFANNSKRAERATEPVRILPQGQMSLLLVLRPINNATELDYVTAFAPGRRLPHVQIRDKSYLRCWDINDSERRVQSLRWELDIHQSRGEPLENWLSEWKHYVGFNPAHSPSHLHINAPAFTPNAPVDERIEHSIEELRLGIGLPNPLGLILSLAAWLRKMSSE
ncbi:MAG: hypothetical protein HYS13_19835 [Planctomycetia bacterium]|nr:hypothetical protein [Planctomycetia bacterium]